MMDRAREVEQKLPFPPKSRVFVNGPRPSLLCKNGNNCENNASAGARCALVWKSTCNQRETVIFICELGDEGDRELIDVKQTLKRLKLNATKTGCTCLTDSLQISRLEDYPFRGTGNKIDDTATFTQLVDLYGEGVNPKKDEYFFHSNAGKHTEWSLLLHRINNRTSIEDIIRSGMVPKVVSSISQTSKSGVNSSVKTATNLHLDTGKVAEDSIHGQFKWVRQVFLENSMTILQYHVMESTFMSWVALVRFGHASLALLRESRANERNEVEINDNSQPCTLCSNPTLMRSKLDLSKRRVAKWNALLTTFFDAILGLIICAMIFLLVHRGHQNAIKIYYIDPKMKIIQSLEDQIGWLETFPAGFKLNVQLTNSMGYGIQSFIQYQKRILLMTFWNLHFCQDYCLPVLAILAAAGGWSTFLAAILDMWRFEILHITLLAILFRKLYQVELFLLSALFRLFRGKKRNVLRQRTDTMKYDMMQLLVGTVAFCVCVFLWTTIMIYYTFFVIWNLWVHLPLMVCSMLYLLSRFVPWGSLLFRIRKPNWFPKDVYLSIHEECESNTQHCFLESKLESPIAILFHRIKGPLKGLFRWYLISVLELIYPRSSHKSHSFLPLRPLVDDQKL